MKKIVILGAGTGGTIMANKLSRLIDLNEWEITAIDQKEKHYYQPGFLFIPFGIYGKSDIAKDKKSLISKKIKIIFDKITKIDQNKNLVKLQNSNINYDILIIATGSDIVIEELDVREDIWGKNIFDFYTFEGAFKLQNALKNFKSGKLAIHIQEFPIKCPVAPLEFTFLSDFYFKDRNLRNKIDITFVTPLPGAFTTKNASKMLCNTLRDKKINVEGDFATSHIEKKQIVSFDGRTVDFDILVTIPTNMGSKFLEGSGLEDELRFIYGDKHTLQIQKHPNIFVIGDCSNFPTSKAGSVVHFQSEILIKNIISYIDNKELSAKYDGHANCFLESGHGKGILIDFNYETEPYPGKFPFPLIGPLSLLKETRLNHYGKLLFKWIYWNILLKGMHIPFTGPNMSMMGKNKVE